MPKISIIVPVYKVEQYLMQCADSLMNQTFRDIEIIFVDDGSPDNCGHLCDILAEQDTRIRVIHQDNQGLSCARNAGVDAATGDYVCFVDSDDMVAPDYCQRLLELLDGTTYDFSYCGVCRFQDGELPKPSSHDEEFNTTNSEYLQAQFERKTEFGVWNKLFRNNFVKRVRFAPGKIHEDVIFSADLLKNLSHGAVYTTKELYFYRQRESGIVSTQSKRCSPDRIYAGEYLLQAVRKAAPELTKMALQYAIEYPWMFIDPIYVQRSFHQNQDFLKAIQKYLRDNISEYKLYNIFSATQTNRMSLFSKSRFMYGFNAYARLIRVYVYRIIGKDAYRDGHGI